MKVLQTSALPLGYGAVFGADDEIRTRDLILTKDVRYHLCHISIERGERRFLPKRGGLPRLCAEGSAPGRPIGADYGVRTRYLDLGKVALYQMS